MCATLATVQLTQLNTAALTVFQHTGELFIVNLPVNTSSSQNATLCNASWPFPFNSGSVLGATVV